MMRSKARTFYLASLFLPKRSRHDIAVIYAYFRTIDDLVDEPADRGRDDVLEMLAGWEDGIWGRRSADGWLLGELLRLADRYGIPYHYLVMVIEGARFDIDMRAIDTYDELIEYSNLVAGSVGMIMAHILGATHDAALRAASDLGVAMQVTNVLRDVREDLDRGRVYLPRADLLAAGCTPEMLQLGVVTPGLRAVMQTLLGEARALYRSGIGGIPYLEKSAQFSIYLAATLYAQILVKIERHDFDVFSQRASLGRMEKWMLALPAYAQHRQLAVRR